MCCQNLLTGLINPGLIIKDAQMHTYAYTVSAYTVNSAPPINFACGIINFEKTFKYLNLDKERLE